MDAHDIPFGLLLYSPAGQGRQVSGEVAPLVDEAVPGGQIPEHVVAPGAG